MVNNNIYSYSRLNTFEQCPLKFKYKYIDKIPEIEKTIEALLGFTIHLVLEYLYNEVKAGRIPSVDEIITIYSDTWKENHNEKIIIVREDLTAEHYFNKGVQFLLDYYMKHKPFDDNTLEVEKKVEILLDENENKKLIGYIDRLVHNMENNQLEIHDYKTSNSLPMQEDIDNDKQLALYSLAIKEEFGHDKEVILIWHYLAHNKKICSRRTNEQLQQLKKETLELIKKIEATEKFPPYISKLCDWCTYKSICPAWGNHPKQRELGDWD